jgi:dTDP-3-amino-3,6-dideoxy-alpha-D-glucopyranose N,N-dimethyltransferase
VLDILGGTIVFRATAHVYDLIYEAMGKDYSAESDQIRGEILARNPSSRTLLDVACGTGGHSAHLRDWFTVTGVDMDTAMLEQARRRLPGVELIQGDMRSLALARRFDAVICLFSSIGYMTTVEELDTAIKVMADHLEPGGVLIVDGWLRPDAWIDPGTTHMECAESGDLKVVRVGRSRRDGDRSYLEMHYLIASVNRIDHVVEHHALRLFDNGQYRSAFTNAALRVECVDSPMPGRDRYIGQPAA